MEHYQPGKKYVVMTRDEVRAFDSWAINTVGIPGAVLMENAGRSCAELAVEKLAGRPNPKVCIFCGTGNNGGDGYVIARHLRNCCVDVVLVICGDRGKISGDALTNLQIIERLGQQINYIDVNEADIAAVIDSFAVGTNMIVDAIFGTGLHGMLSDAHKALIESINALDIPVLAVDIPSGLDCDTGLPLGAAIKAAYTVTFAALKKGFLIKTAPEYTCEIFIASLGVELFEIRGSTD